MKNYNLSGILEILSINMVAMGTRLRFHITGVFHKINYIAIGHRSFYITCSVLYVNLNIQIKMARKGEIAS